MQKMRTRIINAPAVVLYTAKTEEGHRLIVKASASAIVSLLLLNVTETAWLLHIHGKIQNG